MTLSLLKKTVIKFFDDLKSNSALLYNKGIKFWKSLLTWKILQNWIKWCKQITAPPNAWCNIPFSQVLKFIFLSNHRTAEKFDGTKWSSLPSLNRAKVKYTEIYGQNPKYFIFSAKWSPFILLLQIWHLFWFLDILSPLCPQHLIILTNWLIIFSFSNSLAINKSILCAIPNSRVFYLLSPGFELGT